MKKTKKPFTKEQQLIEEWRAYNKRNRDSRNQMSLEDYRCWVLNVKTTKSKKSLFATSKSEPRLDKPTWASTTDHIRSIGVTGTNQPTRNTMMERVRMGFETGETAEAIINKSKRIGLMYSKGTYGYITDGTDVKDLGKKNPTI